VGAGVCVGPTVWVGKGTRRVGAGVATTVVVLGVALWVGEGFFRVGVGEGLRRVCAADELAEGDVLMVAVSEPCAVVGVVRGVLPLEQASSSNALVRRTNNTAILGF
jgi:hypothetical protein